jgi:hypothetical protein
MTVVSLILAFASACYLAYVTVQGYRTGVLKVRGGPYDRRKQPRVYWVSLILLAIVSVVAFAALIVVIYGETHPGWRHRPAPGATQPAGKT